MSSISGSRFLDKTKRLEKILKTVSIYSVGFVEILGTQMKTKI